MNRRELVKALPAICATPLFIKGKEVGKVLALHSEKSYVIFLNGHLVDIEEWVHMDHPRALSGTPVYAVFPDGRNGTMDEIIRIYEVGSDEETQSQRQSERFGRGDGAKPTRDRT